MIVARDMAARIVANVSHQGGIADLLPRSDWLLLVSAIIPSIFVVVAVLWIRRSRMTALRSFHRAVLLSICFTEVFMFYRNQAVRALGSW